MIKLTNLLLEKTVKVKNNGIFKNAAAIEKFIAKLGANDKVSDDVIDGETGEVIMNRGESKSKIAKRHRKKYTTYDKWDDFYFMDHHDDYDFKELFNIVYRDFGKGLSDEEKKMYTDGDYEWEFKYPSKIKRKDGKPFTENDARNIEEFAKWYSKNVLAYGSQLSVYAKEGKKIAMPEPQFL